jgi:sugar phosphate isomerase/epimerase
MMKESKNIPRREFLQLSALGVAGASLALSGCASEKSGARAAKIPVGLQLYSVRADCRADFPGTIEKVAKIGYKGVEFAGYWDRSAKDIRKMLDDNGLVACGSHTPSEKVQPDKLDETIEFNQIIGNHFIIVPDMTGATRHAWLEKAKRFNDIAEALRPKRLSIGYHSHWHDFHPVEGGTPWDIFGENTQRDVILQLDTSNCVDGGSDLMTELKKFPGRTRTIHLKPNGGGSESVIAEDKINWPAVFEFCETRGGTQWYVVEHESSKTPLDAVARTFEKLKQLGKV